jgi:hypothetical protein
MSQQLQDQRQVENAFSQMILTFFNHLTLLCQIFLQTPVKTALSPMDQELIHLKIKFIMKQIP